jgi:DNA replication and repair protein RecF
LPYFVNRYKGISGSQEEVDVVYDSQLHNNSLAELLQESMDKDRILQFTSTGPHKDDLQFKIDGYPIKKYGSQGQQKTFLVALKLAQYDMMQHQTKLPPILLLDDIFDKLDDQRVSHIVDLVHDEAFGQLFISDTHRERTEEIIQKTGQSYSIFTLNKNK